MSCTTPLGSRCPLLTLLTAALCCPKSATGTQTHCLLELCHHLICPTKKSPIFSAARQHEQEPAHIPRILSCIKRDYKPRIGVRCWLIIPSLIPWQPTTRRLTHRAESSCDLCRGSSSTKTFFVFGKTETSFTSYLWFIKSLGCMSAFPEWLLLLGSV